MKRSTKFSPEVVERAVHIVFEANYQYDSQWAESVSFAGKIGFTARGR